MYVNTLDISVFAETIRRKKKRNEFSVIVQEKVFTSILNSEILFYSLEEIFSFLNYFRQRSVIIPSLQYRFNTNKKILIVSMISNLFTLSRILRNLLLAKSDDTSLRL